jgi:hypothetical protein
MTKKDILKKYKMTEQEFYKKFPTQEAFQKFEMGGNLNNSVPIETSNSTQYAPDADFFNSPDSPASSSNFSVATGGPTTIKQKPAITVSDPNDPRLKSYQDSLALNQNYFKGVEGLRRDLAEDGKTLSRTGSTPLAKWENRSMYDSDKIKPASVVEFETDNIPYSWGFPYYVPPVQPYNLKPKVGVNTTPQKPVEARVKRKFDKMPILPFRGTEVSKNQLEPNLQAREVPQMKTSNIEDSNVYTASKMLGKLGESTGYTNKGMNQGREENTQFKKMGGYLFSKKKYDMGGLVIPDVTDVTVPTDVTTPVTKTVSSSPVQEAINADNIYSYHPPAAESGGKFLKYLKSDAGRSDIKSTAKGFSNSSAGAQQPNNQQPNNQDPKAPEQENIGKTIGTLAGLGIGIGATIATGGAALPLIPAITSAGGGIGGFADKQVFKNKTEDYNAVKSSQQNAMSSNIPGNFAQKQFAAGGEIGELFTDFKGNTHEDGGTTFPGTNIEVEKNETKAKLPDGRKVIFTNSPDIPYKGKRTYAQEHRSIEKKYFRPGLVDSNTKKRLIPKLFEDQEMKKEQMQAMMLTNLKNDYMMYGGKLKMATGGGINYNHPMSDDRATLVSGNFDSFGASTPKIEPMKSKSFAPMSIDKVNPKPFLVYQGPNDVKNFQDWLDVNQPTWYQGSKFSQNPDYKGYYGTYGTNTQKAYKNFGNDYETMIADQQRRKNLNLTPMPRMGVNKPDDLKINDKMLDVPDYPFGPGKSSPKKYDGPSYANLAVQGIGDAYSIAQGLKGGDPVNFDRMNTKYQFADPRGAMTAANRGITAAYNPVKNAAKNTTTSAAEYLANMTNIASKEGPERASTMAGIKNQYDAANTQGLNQSNLMKDEYNAKAQMAESVARQQEEDAGKYSLHTGLKGLGAKVGGFNSAKNSWNNQNDLLSLMRSKGFYPIEGKDGEMMWIKDGVNVPYEVGIKSALT